MIIYRQPQKLTGDSDIKRADLGKQMHQSDIYSWLRDSSNYSKTYLIHVQISLITLEIIWYELDISLTKPN